MAAHRDHSDDGADEDGIGWSNIRASSLAEYEKNAGGGMKKKYVGAEAGKRHEATGKRHRVNDRSMIDGDDGLDMDMSQRGGGKRRRR